MSCIALWVFMGKIFQHIPIDDKNLMPHINPADNVAKNSKYLVAINKCQHSTDTGIVGLKSNTINPMRIIIPKPAKQL